jgi:four helix bundle protein
MKQFRTYQLAKALYHDAKVQKVKGAMRDQLERASLSIVLNLAEGSAKQGEKDRKKFFVIAMGSLRETQAIFDLLGNQKLMEDTDKLAAHIHKLIQNPGPGPAA